MTFSKHWLLGENRIVSFERKETNKMRPTMVSASHLKAVSYTLQERRIQIAQQLSPQIEEMGINETKVAEFERQSAQQVGAGPRDNSGVLQRILKCLARCSSLICEKKLSKVWEGIIRKEKEGKFWNFQKGSLYSHQPKGKVHIICRTSSRILR